MILGVVLVIFVALAAVAEWFVFSSLRRRKPRRRRRQGPPRPFEDEIRAGKAWIDAAHSEEVSIVSHDGLRLCGRFYPAREPTPNAVLAVHGYRSSGRHDFAGLLPLYHELGWNVLLIDQRAHGASEGTYIGMGCLERHDCARWAAFLDEKLRRETGGANLVLHGVSMGGATVLLCGAMPLPGSVRGILDDCGYSSVFEVFRHVLRRDYHLPAFPLLHLAGLLCRIQAGFGFHELSPVEAVRVCELPLCIIHGDRDDFVPTRMALELYDAVRPQTKKRLLLAKGAAHAQSCYAAANEYRELISDFLAEAGQNRDDEIPNRMDKRAAPHAARDASHLTPPRITRCVCARSRPSSF